MCLEATPEPIKNAVNVLCEEQKRNIAKDVQIEKQVFDFFLYVVEYFIFLIVSTFYFFVVTVRSR